ncbi:MAG TPA: hypothetical protein PKN62_01440 [bacterium]|nr:hypothetical protein [bacterium]
MDITTLVDSLKNDDTSTFERKCKDFFYNRYEFSSFDQKNRDFVIELLKKHRSDMINFGGIPGYRLDNEMYDLHSRRDSYDLSEIDYENIKKIMQYFRA